VSNDRDATRIVRSWLEEGVTRLPDQILDAVVDQLPATPQRRVVSWPARRLPTMNTFLKFGIAAVVVAAAVLIGINTFGASGVGGPGLDPSTAPADATATPAPTPSPTPFGLLPEGPHVLATGEDPGGQVALPVSVTIPALGWYGEPGGGILAKNDNVSGPDGAGMIGPFVGELFVYGDPCRWSTTRPETPATTVDGFVAALAGQASRDASEPVDITVDGYSGKEITLHVPEDAVFDDCDLGLFGSWGVPGRDESPYRYHQDPGQIDVVWALDVDGTLAVFDWSYYAETPQDDIDELRAIMESIDIE
jgi:hypothetical protein